MPAPSSFPDWDTGAVNVTPIVAGHTASGWANSEVPDSDEMNQWMMLVGLWVRYLSGLLTVTDTIPAMPGTSVSLSGGTAVPQGPNSGTPLVDISSGTLLSGNVGAWMVGFRMGTGKKITGARAMVNLISGTGAFDLYEGTNAGASLVGSVTFSSTGNQTVVMTGLPVNGAAGTWFYLFVSAIGSLSSGAEVKLFGFELDTQPQ